MTSPEDIERRLRAIAQDAAAARVLAAGADRDCAEMKVELRSHTKVLNSLRETQMEHGKAIKHLEKRMDEGFKVMNEGFKVMNEGFTVMNEGFAVMDEGFARTEQQFAKVGQGMAHIVTLLEQRPHDCQG